MVTGIPASSAASSAARRLLRITARYSAATTVSVSVPATVACGDVVVQATAPAVFVQAYQAPAALSFAFTVPVAGEIVKATESRFVGVVLFMV
jgi:hypothetical protein